MAVKVVEHSRPRLIYPPELPIAAFGEEIVRVIREQPVVIIAGEPGSGKTTQLPKMCLAAGRGRKRRIGCTQPRRIAAMSMAARLAEELGAAGPELVGYRIRFQDRTSRATRIKFMTDGILLAEAQADPDLRQYDTIIIDEAHERSLNIDFLLGLLKKLQARRPELKLIITSATIDTAKFSRHFGDAPVIEVSGRGYPIEIEYRPPDSSTGEEIGPVEQAVAAVTELCRRPGGGDILLFMPTERDIRETVELLPSALGREVTVLPLYGRLGPGEQKRIFQPCRGRKIVVATNVAETSITVPGIRYVVDSGLARIAAYNPRARTHKLPVVPVSRASCDQRAGRCGRVGPGLCVRLYSEDDYLGRPPYTPPEIVRSNLAEVILRMFALKLGEPAEFPFVDPPSQRAIRDGYALLAELEALDEGRQLTAKGRLMARLPLDPCIARMIIEARDQGALREVMVIAAALGIQDPRIRPPDKEAEADRRHQPFLDKRSDFLFYLNLWETCQKVLTEGSGRSRFRKFCAGHFLSWQRMREWLDIHEQISEVLTGERGFAVVSDHRAPHLAAIGPAHVLTYASPSGLPLPSKPGAAPCARLPRGARDQSLALNAVPADYGAIHRAILSGNLRNIALKKEKNLYQGGGGRPVMIFPGSALYNRGGAWIMAAELVETTRLFARTVAVIEPEWIEPLAKGLVRYSYSEPHWEKRSGRVVALEKGMLFGLVIVAGRKVAFGRIDPVAARRIFLQSALVEGELGGDYPFLRHNQELIARLQEMEERTRRRDLLVDDQTIFAFYDERLPAEVDDQAALNRLLKQQRGDGFLHLREEDLLRQEAPAEELAAFPETLAIGELTLPLSYRFAPGAEDDGVTVMIPRNLAPHLRPERFEWLVPGLLLEKVTLLLKGLPKNVRRHLVPIPQTAAALIRVLHPGPGSLYQSLANAIDDLFRLRVEGNQWPRQQLPLHLQCRFALLDGKGRVVAAGRDLPALLGEAAAVDRGGESAGGPAAERLRGQWEQGTLASAELPEIPARLPLTGNDRQLAGYLFPALVKEGEQVALRLLNDPEEAREATRQGLLHLYGREFARQLKELRKNCLIPRQLWALCEGFGQEELNRDIYQFVLTGIFAVGSGRIPTAAEFAARAEQVRQQGVVPLGRKIFALITAVLEERRATLDMLARLAGAKDGGLGQELRAEVAALVPGDFLHRYDAAALAHLPRYLKALRTRAERAQSDPGKDRAKAALLAPHQERLRSYQEESSRLAPEKRQLLNEYRQMLEEYKVSLFAQELKTAFPISPKRLAEQWQAIERCS